MKVPCGICGKGVSTTAKNYIYANELHQHKRCPKTEVLTDEEKKDRKDLTDAIKWACVRYNKPEYWRKIVGQIDRFLAMGYSYKDQLYTLKFVIEKEGTFWGYGRIERFFAHAIEHKKRQEEYEARKKEAAKQDITIKQLESRHSFMKF